MRPAVEAPGESSIERPTVAVRRGGRGLSLGRPGERLAVVLLLATIAATWLLSDVAVWEALRFVAFEVFYVLLPGCMLYVLLSPKPGGWLRTLAIGWPCGYALELGAFALTAAVHARGAFTLLPLLALATMGPLLYRRARRELAAWRLDGARVTDERALDSDLPDGASWRRAVGLDSLVVAIACSVALVLLAFTFFAPYPLPAHARSVSYSEDNVFDISLAAEARHHWPISEPWVAGQPLHYYTGVFIHAAAINQVTGVALATIVLRLLPSMMLLVVALQLWSLGRSLGRSRWIGPVAVVLLLVLEDLNLDATHTEVFHINPFNQFSLSPSFAFGVPFFLGLLELVQSRLLERGPSGRRRARDPPAPPRAGARRSLILVALLVLGCGATKTFAAADFIGGLGLFWLWCLLTARPTRLLSACLALSIVCVLAIYFAMLAGGMAGTLSIHPFDFITSGATLVRVKSAMQSVIGHSGLWILPLLASVPVVAAFLFAPLLGALWLLRARESIPPLVVLLLAMFVAGAVAYLTLGAPGGVEGVFLVYGYIAMAPVAAMGLVSLWNDAPRDARRKLAGACVVVLAWGLVMAASAQVLTLTGVVRDGWYLLAYGLLATGIALIVYRYAGHFAPAVSSRPGRVLACCIPLLGVLGLVKPLTLAGVGAWKTVSHQQISTPDSAKSYGMTTALYRGLLWVRAHTAPCDVLAVNNHLEAVGSRTSLYFYYSAFTERRVYLESWFYSPNGTRMAQPFPARYRLNTEAVSQGNPAALRKLGEAGVSYVLVDKTHGGGAPEQRRSGQLVFSNRALDVYRLAAAGRGTAGAGASCGTVA